MKKAQDADGVKADDKATMRWPDQIGYGVVNLALSGQVTGGCAPEGGIRTGSGELWISRLITLLLTALNCAEVDHSY